MYVCRYVYIQIGDLVFFVWFWSYVGGALVRGNERREQGEKSWSAGRRSEL